jgi:hypothetical protein
MMNRARRDRVGNWRCTVRKLLVAVGVVGSLGLAGSAMARPWDRDNAAPPHTIRSEVSVRMAADGRADLQVDHSARQDPYDRTVSKPQADRNYGQERHAAPIPLKADIAIRMQHGDNRDGGSAMAKQATAQQQSGAVDNSYGRAKPQAPVPLKADITIRMQHGDDREGGDSRGAAARPSDRNERTSKLWHTREDREHGMKTPLSREQKDVVCKHTGICLPTLVGSDDSDDKSE